METKHPDYDKHYEEWRRTLPAATHEVLHEKVMAHIAHKESIRAGSAKNASMPVPCRFIDRPIASMDETNRLLRFLIAAVILAALILFGALVAKAEPPAPVVEFDAAHYLLLHPYTFAQVGSVPIPLPVQGSGSSNPVYVICSSGCSAAGAFSDNSAFTVGTTPGSILFGYYTSGSAPTLSSGNAARARIDASSYLFVDCAVGCNGGTFNNNSDAVATSATNGQSAAWLYGFNGTTFDRLRVDGSKNLEVNINASSATVPVSGTFWQTTQPVSGTFWQTTQPVSGTFWQTTQPASCTAANCSINLADLDGTALGAPSNYGTSPGAVAVPGVNAYVTNTVPVTGTFYQATQPISAASLPLPSNAAQETGGNLATIAGAITSSVVQSNTKQVNGVTTLAGAGATGTGSQRVTVAQDQTTNGGQNPDPCGAAHAKSYTPFSLASTTALKVVTKSSGLNVYVCSIAIVSASAENVALIAGTKTSVDCDTSTAGLMGGTTAATGFNFAANGGLTFGNGSASVAATASTGLDVCLLSSGTTQLSGVISWTQF